MSKGKGVFLPGVGISSLLVIFAVLCLTVFALLSVSTVLSSSRLADRSCTAITEYYAADCAAEEILAQLRAGHVPEGVTQEGNRYYYDCPIGDSRMLTVCVELEAEQYRILRWQAVSAEEWQAQDDLPVWDGEQP